MDLPNFQRARFDDVFKNTPLPDFYGQQYSSTPIQSMPPPMQYPAATTLQPLKRTLTNGSPAPISATPVASSPSTTASSLAHPTPESAEASWATVGKSGVSPNENISIAPKATLKKKYLYYNRSGERLDEPLPSRDPAAVQSIEQRMKKGGRNLCNHWHLNNGKCHNNDLCKFQHQPKLSTAEQIALRYKTRSLACKNRYCDNWDCCRPTRDTAWWERFTDEVLQIWVISALLNATKEPARTLTVATSATRMV
jgi:hypothetical protein